MTAIYSSYMLMFVPSFNRIERGLDGGQLLHTKQDACFACKSVNTNVSLSAAKTRALVPANRHNCYAN